LPEPGIAYNYVTLPVTGYYSVTVNDVKPFFRLGRVQLEKTSHSRFGVRRQSVSGDGALDPSMPEYKDIQSAAVVGAQQNL
jgi:hypothetical protein